MIDGRIVQGKHLRNAWDGGDLREDPAPCIKLDLNIVGGILYEQPNAKLSFPRTPTSVSPRLLFTASLFVLRRLNYL